MSYVPHEWTKGETITAGKLNHIENGVANNQILTATISASELTYTLDKTWKEIYDSFTDGIPVFLFDSVMTEDGVEMLPVYSCYVYDTDYDVYAWSYDHNSSVWFTTDSQNGYPSHTESLLVE